jgi:hypothetical protein
MVVYQKVLQAIQLDISMDLLQKITGGSTIILVYLSKTYLIAASNCC